MKNLRKLITLLLSLVLVFSLSISVFAESEGTYTITICNETKGHVYEAYQIFTGTLSADGKTLSDVEWGSGITEAGKTALGNAGAVSAELETAADANAFAKEIAVYLSDSKVTSTEVASPYTITGLAAGYYLVEEASASAPEDGAAYTEYIVRVVGDVSVDAKDEGVVSEKKVKDTNDSVADSTTGWQDSADYDVGDAIPFQLKAILPENYDVYSVYRLTFHDKESDGLTFDAESVKVYIDGKLVDAEDYQVLTSVLSDGCTFEVSFEDLKTVVAADDHQAAPGSEVTVEYTSTLNNGAVLGSQGNPNIMFVTYSNNPYHVGEGGENGKTPEDQVIVFTYKLVVNKVGEDEETPLEGAGFTLYKQNAADGQYVAVGSEQTGEAMTTFTWSHLDDGNYRIVETTTPDGYNTIDSIEFTITAEHEVLSDSPTLTSLSGDVSSGEAEFSAVVSTGSLATTVVNQTGATLPETGGIGTTLFYIVGGIFVLVAGVLLVTKKRMSAEE